MLMTDGDLRRGGRFVPAPRPDAAVPEELWQGSARGFVAAGVAGGGRCPGDVGLTTLGVRLRGGAGDHRVLDTFG